MFKKLFLILAFIAVIVGMTSGCGTRELPENADRHINLNGTWKSAEDGIAFTATVEADRIKVHMQLRDTDGLYWAGTFNSLLESPGNIYSNADEEVLKSSMFGSLDKTKTFVYDNDAISFKFGMAGVTKTVHLTRGNI